MKCKGCDNDIGVRWWRPIDNTGTPLEPQLEDLCPRCLGYAREWQEVDDEDTVAGLI